MQTLVSEGLRIMRLNFSHATVEEADLRLTNLRESSGQYGLVRQHKESCDSSVLKAGCVGLTGGGANLRASLLDTQGPEIRTTSVDSNNSKAVIELTVGQTVTVRSTKPMGTEEELKSTATLSTAKSGIFVQYEAGLHNIVPVDGQILLDDGAVSLTVTAVEGQSLTCNVNNSGSLRSRVGVNLPGVSTGLPAMSAKDKTDILYGLQNDVDFVAASFVSTAQGVHDIRAFIQTNLESKSCTPPLIISKIESLEALQNFDEILEASDGIMVARGDLGVEVPIHLVPTYQKSIVASCNAAAKRKYPKPNPTNLLTILKIH